LQALQTLIPMEKQAFGLGVSLILYVEKIFCHTLRKQNRKARNHIELLLQNSSPNDLNSSMGFGG
jgi:hypothetical protein